METSNLKWWAEVHFEVVSAIVLTLDSGNAKKLQKEVDQCGFQHLYKVAFGLTEKFIAMPEPNNQEFWEAIEKFMDEELSIYE